LVKALLAEKSSATGDKNVKDLRCRLENRFCALFGNRLVQSIRSDELSRWLNGLVCSQRNKRNYHASVVTLFEFAKENGYLPKGKPSEIQLIKKKKADAIDVEIFTPDELIKMIRSALVIKSPALVPLLIQSLAGLRTEEIEQTDEKKDRLQWGDIRLGQSFPDVHVRKKVSKTKRERFAPIAPALLSWLRRLRSDSQGAVYARMSLYKDYRRIL
jgi:integrase